MTEQQAKPFDEFLIADRDHSHYGGVAQRLFRFPNGVKVSVLTGNSTLIHAGGGRAEVGMIIPGVDDIRIYPNVDQAEQLASILLDAQTMEVK